MKILAVSAALDIGFTFATIWSQSGIDDIGRRALLANRSGRFRRLTTAISVSHFAILIEMAVNMLAKPKASKNITEKTPRRSSPLNPGASLRPLGMTSARPNMTTAWIIPLTTLESTLERKMEVRGIGAARRALRMLKRLSKTMDMPLNAALNRRIRQSIPPVRYVM